jgi:hypothetical protein
MTGPNDNDADDRTRPPTPHHKTHDEPMKTPPRQHGSHDAPTMPRGGKKSY